MTMETPEHEEVVPAPVEPVAGEVAGPDLPEGDVRQRRLYCSLLFFLLPILVGLVVLLVRYIRQPVPLPDLLPGLADLTYSPHYVFSVYGVDLPVGVALAPDGKRIYIVESGGERLVKIFSQDGEFQGAFAPPGTSPPERSPVYVDVAPSGQVYVTDRAQHAVFVYDQDGNFLDTLLSPDLTLREYLTDRLGELPSGTQFGYNIYHGQVAYRLPDGGEAHLPAPDRYPWSPLGISIDRYNRLLLTDATSEHSHLRVFEPEFLLSGGRVDFDPLAVEIGEFGRAGGQFIFPNSAAVDGHGRIYVTDSNNSRVSVWSNEGAFLFHFGQGTGEGSLNLPRGLDLDTHDRLYVVDAVAQCVSVYDVSGEDIEYLFRFGDFGLDDGQFNYPNDVAVDASGRIYVVDRENNRLQVWMY